jgi:hypothetical protein
VSGEHAYLREYRDRGSVGLWLLYRIVYLAREDVGGDDSFEAQNRRTPLIEGVVCRSRPQFDATGELFAAVHELCRPAVRDFYTEDSETFPVHRCESLRAPVPAEPAAGHVLPVVQKNPYVSERNLQVALRGHHPRPLREPAPTVRTSVPAAGSAGLGGAGGPHGRGRGALRDGQGGEGGRRRPAQGPGRDIGAVVGRPAGPVRTVVVVVGAAGLLVLVLLVLLLAGVFG